MSKELMDALDMLEKEKNISKESLFEAIENSLLTACKNHFGKSDNVRVVIDPDTCDYHVFVDKTVVPDGEHIEDPFMEISLSDAALIQTTAAVDDVVSVEMDSKEFSRIATQSAKNVIIQKIKEEERGAVYKEYHDKEHNVVTGVVQRFMGHNISVNLGRTDATLSEKEQVRILNGKGELIGKSHYRIQDRLKLYILEVKDGSKGPRIMVSRTHPDLVKCLFEQEVTEIKDGIVQIMAIAREPGSRTKIAVYSNNPNVDPVGACVGVNGSRVNLIVDELSNDRVTVLDEKKSEKGREVKMTEKIDVILWDENPGNLIQNALSPAKIVAVFADPDEKTAKVVVPDLQLSLAIGKEGQNARLAARLTGYKIDINSESQAKDAPGFRFEDYMDEFEDGDEYEMDGEGALLYDEMGNYIGDDAYEEEYEDTEVASADADENSDTDSEE